MNNSDPEKKSPSAKQIAELTAQLKAGIQSYLQSGKYEELLRTMAKFPNYSLNNTILISLQTNGQATQVAPYTAWKAMGRSVNAGEKGIKIIAPTSYQRTILQEKKDTNGKSLIGSDGKVITETVKVRAMGYRVAYTFDISQTSGKALPTVMTELQGKVHNYADFRKAIQEVCPVEIVTGPIEGNTKGYYSPDEQEVRIREGMSELQNIKTALHETAHARLHNPALTECNFSQSEKEIQAESIAFIVAAHYGLDTSDYSFPYVSVWASGNVKRIEENLEIIKKESAKIISEIDESLEKNRMEQMQIGIYQYDEGYLKLQRQEDDRWHYERYGKDMQPKISGSIDQKGLRLDQAATSALFILGYTGSKHLISQEAERFLKNMVEQHTHTRSRHR